MRNQSGLQGAGGRGGANYGRGRKFIPSTLRAISSYLRSVSSNASNIAATVRTAGTSIASSISQPDEDKREQVFIQFVYRSSVFAHKLTQASSRILGFIFYDFAFTYKIPRHHLAF
ncbi:hypothetical protein O6H91_Y222000 [Diphasiastrum complanatum]|nr:hypothetical protein O6H91_Y222000 [Diphasiastrum complanatum]